MKDIILTLPLTQENAEYLIKIVCCTVFGCYQGDKKADDLIGKPEIIKQEDFEDIALHHSEVKKAQTIITDLQKLLY